MKHGDGRNAQLVRVLLLAKRLQYLRQQPSLTELARYYNVHTRTIRRDLEALEEAGWPVPQWRQRGEFAGETA